MKEQISFRLAGLSDRKIIRGIQDASFGVHIVEEEFEQIVSGGKGSVFLGESGNIPVIFLVILFKNFDETYLQPALKKAIQSGEPVMHDDVHIIEGKEAYFHLLGVKHEFQGRHIAHSIMQYALSNLPQMNLTKTACIRINNLPSIKTAMDILGMSMISLKPINTGLIGSQETNFSASSEIPSISDRAIVGKPYVWTGSMPPSTTFLLPVANGSEGELAQQPELKPRLVQAFRSKFIVRGLFKGSEIGFDNNWSYFYLAR